MAPNWAACDYVLFDNSNDRPIIFIIEKSDLLLAAKNIKKNNGVYDSFIDVTNTAIKDNCKCAPHIKEEISDAILKGPWHTFILEGLVEEYNRKLYCSLLILLRLQNYGYLKDLLLNEPEYRYVILNIPSKASLKKHGMPEAEKELSIKVLKDFGRKIKGDVEQKRNSIVSENSMNISFSGVLGSPKELRGYLKKYSKSLLQ